MRKRNASKLSESGATFVEYALSAAILIIGIVVATQTLTKAINANAEQSMNTVSDVDQSKVQPMAPCAQGKTFKTNECW